MKLASILITVLLVLLISAYAIPITEFKSWDKLTQDSPEIVIARCTSTLDFQSATNPITIVVDNMYVSDIEVVSVLKGTPNPGKSTMASQYWPYRGECFLLFANNQKDDQNRGYTAVEPYRVIPLGHNFFTNQLSGKTLEEQIQTVFERRLYDLNEEMESDKKEKERLEKGLTPGGWTNAPVRVPFRPTGTNFRSFTAPSP